MDWSPDGNSIAVVLRRQDGTAQIGIVRIADGKMNVLQSTDWRGATRVFFSPDGRDVAFDVPVNDSSDELDIRVVAVDGSRGSTPVHDPSQNIIMGWAPDGRHVLFASDRTGTLGLWAQRLTDGKADGPSRMVHAGLGGAWSLGITKTGSLYFGVQSGDRDVEVLNVDLKTGKQTSSSARPITRFVGTNWMPEWSRDGRFLAYASRRSVSGNGGHIIGIRDSSTGTVRELRPKVTYLEGLAWSPDGKTLLTNATDFKGRSGVSTIDVGTGDVGFVVAGRFPKFGPDGSRIYYVTPGNGGPNSVIERVLSSGAERTISKGDFVSFTLSPDGRWLAVTRGISDAVTQDLAVVSVESGEVRPVYRAQPGERIPPFIGLPWTPDGQAVLMRKRSPPNELWVVPVTGEPPYRVNAEVEGWSFGSAGVISLHPDGRQIAATRVRQDTGAAVRVLENFLSVLK
jgi:Tol biopolymer transport system component